MPVSLDRLVAEVEAGVVTDELIRDAIIVTGTDPDLAEEKKRELPFSQVECAAFSFRNLARITNLWGLDKLMKLQLDNNSIQKIENLGHLTNLTWLDLSFNAIQRIEGLEQLTRLQDLSLFSNQVSALQGLDQLSSLNVLSIGNNSLADLAGVSYLTRFTHLQLLNLAGNPLCQDADYRSYVLSHLKHLSYLDYRRVQGADRALAMDQHQDEMLELHEQEEAAAAEKATAHAAAMAAANLDGIETLLDDAIAADPEWQKLSAVPGLLEPWNDVRDKWQVATDEFKLIILDAHSRKQAETAEFQAALSQALAERDAEGRRVVAQYDRLHKHLLQQQAAAAATVGQQGSTEEQVLSAKVKLMALQEMLLELEMDCAEVAGSLITEYDRSMSEMAEANKLQYNAYFTQVRDLHNMFFLCLNGSVASYLERYGSSSDNPELDALPEEVQLMLGDKDALVNAIQSSHEVHTGRLDALEDRLVAAELGAANALADKNGAWQEQRHRERVAELLSYMERNMQELDALAADVDEAGEEAAADSPAALGSTAQAAY